jgi:hypothetical protein
VLVIFRNAAPPASSTLHARAPPPASRLEAKLTRPLFTELGVIWGKVLELLRRLLLLPEQGLTFTFLQIELEPVAASLDVLEAFLQSRENIGGKIFKGKLNPKENKISRESRVTNTGFPKLSFSKKCQPLSITPKERSKAESFCVCLSRKCGSVTHVGRKDIL